LAAGSVPDSIFNHPRTPCTAAMRPTRMTGPGSAAPCRAVTPSGSVDGALAGLAHQVLDPVTELRALLAPVVDAREIKAQTLLATDRDRVEEPYPLDETTALCRPAVTHHQLIERTLLGTTAGQTNLYHGSPCWKFAPRGAPQRRAILRG